MLTKHVVLLTKVKISLVMLEHAVSNEMLIAAMQTLRQHTEVWAGLNVLKDIVSTLFQAHCTWKNRGVQNRALLSLMLQLDAGRYLESTAREQVLSDHSVFTHVSVIICYEVTQRC